MRTWKQNSARDSPERRQQQASQASAGRGSAKGLHLGDDDEAMSSPQSQKSGSAAVKSTPVFSAAGQNRAGALLYMVLLPFS